MHKVRTQTVEGYSYLEKPTILGSITEYVSQQFVWPEALQWRGSVFLITLPGVIMMTGIALLVCLLHITYKVHISVPVSVLGTVSVALGLLLAFRVNTAYDRYWEGRKLIQTVMSTIRNLSRQVWINIPEETEQDHLEKMRCVKLLLAFFVATKHHLRKEYGTHYYDLEVLLPPKWVPASVARRNQIQELLKKKSYTKSAIDLRGSNGTHKLSKKDFQVLKKAPSISIDVLESLQVKQDDYYMESDDPTHISNIRRALIQQEFPDSDLTQASYSQLRKTFSGTSLDHTLSEEEHQSPNLLDETMSQIPLAAVQDPPKPNPAESTPDLSKLDTTHPAKTNSPKTETPKPSTVHASKPDAPTSAPVLSPQAIKPPKSSVIQFSSSTKPVKAYELESDPHEPTLPLHTEPSGSKNRRENYKRSYTMEERLHRFKARFHKQQRKGKKRQLDHSEFTSEEDLPYQGDSDLPLPVEILFRVALFINQAKAQGKIESPLVSATTSSLDTLVNSLTAFERIVHTPIPKAYSIHLKQAVLLYIFFLPFALVESVGWLAAPIVSLVSFTLFGIQAIGAEIENPFGYDNNDLPLNRYCDELKKEVEYIIYHIPTHSTSILLDGQ